MTTIRPAVLAALAFALGTILALPWGLHAAARFLVVVDPLTVGDALYVFPGGVPQRAECAANLFQRHAANRVVVTGQRIQPELTVLDMPLSDAEINARVLTRHGVPPDAITILSEGTSTWEDAHALRRWAATQPDIRRVIAVTSPAHSRRARWVLRKVFRGSGIAVPVRPCPPEMTSHWWQHEETLIRVINEYIKLAYYVVSY